MPKFAQICFYLIVLGKVVCQEGKVVEFSEEGLAVSVTEVHNALRAWDIAVGENGDLLEHLLLVQQKRERSPNDKTPATLRLATNELLLDAIDELEQQDQEAARVLRSRFIERHKLLAVANQINVSEHTVSRIQRAAIDHLTKIINGREQALRDELVQKVESKLQPATYSRLFGLDNTCNELENLLYTDSPWVIALVGMGGIGKTAIADAVVRRAIRRFHFDEVVWIRTEPQTMSGLALSPETMYRELILSLAKQLLPTESASNEPFERQLYLTRQLLKQRPCLIVIDNLENETDTAYLFAHLTDLANPSKFLLTSRTRHRDQGIIFSFEVAELELPEAAALLRHHAQDVGVKAMVNASDAEIEQIYKVVGGNPLALKLVISLLDLLPLSQVLTAISRSQAGAIEEMYMKIYWQTWQHISTQAKQLLQAMPIVSEVGGDSGYLQALSGLTDADFWPALQELRTRSLLEVRGTLQEKRYGVHRLTETFLRTEIIHLPEDK